MINYETEVNLIGETIIKKTDANGTVWWIPADPANSDYQAYLNRDNPDYGNKL